jgi:hypothetical protein
MRRILTLVWITALAAAIAGGLLWSFLAHRADLAAEAESGKPIKNAARVVHDRGETVVKFDRETQQRMGIRTAAAIAVTKRREVAAYGRLEEDPSRSFVLRAPVAGAVLGTSERPWPDIGQNLADRSIIGFVDPRLPPTDRITLNDRLASAKADIESSRAALQTAQAALERARRLNADDKNVSDRVVEEAASKVTAEQARLSASGESARMIESSLASTHASASPLELARGGEVVEVLVHPGESVESGQPILRITRFDQLFARVDLPAGEAVAPDVAEATIIPLGQEDHPLHGERIALGASVDPKTLGQPFLFRIADRALTLRPGLAVTAYLELPGPARTGVLAPRSAVLRQSGRTWIYIQTAEDEFARRPVVLEESTAHGWFTRSLSPGDRIVTVGAQTLLSEEFKSQIQVGDESQP